MIKVQPRGRRRDGQREVVDLGCLARELHAVVDGVLAVFRQHQMRVNVAEVLRHGQVEGHRLTGLHRPERGFTGEVEAVVECVGHGSLPFTLA